MQTLKLSVSLPGDMQRRIELHLSANDSPCNVAIALPAAVHANAQPRDTGAPRSEQDDYVLGGYAGI